MSLVAPAVDRHSAASAKIALFRSLFRGRDDVYRRRFESRRTGKSGYVPACANEWVRGICEKPRIKCAVCPPPGRTRSKFDGYRALGVKTGGKVQLRSRNDNDFTVQYPSIAKALAPLPNETVVDVEVPALDESASRRFARSAESRVQQRARRHGNDGIHGKCGMVESVTYRI